MIHTWLHANGKDYWEGEAIVIELPALPRIGETVYLSEQTMLELLSRHIICPKTETDEKMGFDDAFVITDICYIEGEDLPHIMISTNSENN